MYKTINLKRKAADLTQDELQALEREVIRIQQENAILFGALERDKQAIVAHASALWGAKSAVERYLQRAPIPRPPDYRKAIAKLRREYDREQKRKLHNSRARSYRREYMVRKAATLDELILAGYIPGDDFKPSYAVSFAERINRETISSTN